MAKRRGGCLRRAVVVGAAIPALFFGVVFFALAGAPPTGRDPVVPVATGSAATFDPAVCSKMAASEGRVCEFGNLFNVAGSASKVDPRFLAAVAYVESGGFKDDVITCRRASYAGALGLMQFMPDTASERGVDPCNPTSAIFGAAAYLREHYDEFGSWALAAAAYNAGPQPVRNTGGIPVNGQTETYVPAVLAKWEEYKQLFSGTLAECPVEPRGPTDLAVDVRSTRATQDMAAKVVECFGREHSVGCFNERHGNGGKYEHPRGRACDFMITIGGAMPGQPQREHGDAMAEWVAANAAELNVLYVIWYNRIWNAGDPYKPIGEWDDYGCGGCGNTQAHYDHVHVSVKLLPGDPPSAACQISACSE